MEIQWFNENKQKASVTFYETNLTLNAIAKLLFESVEYVRVGRSKEGELLLCPVSYDDYYGGQVPKQECYPVVTHSSYGRISSKSLLKQIADSFGLKFTKDPLRVEAFSVDGEYLKIPLGQLAEKGG